MEVARRTFCFVKRGPPRSSGVMHGAMHANSAPGPWDAQAHCPERTQCPAREPGWQISVFPGHAHRCRSGAIRYRGLPYIDRISPVLRQERAAIRLRSRRPSGRHCNRKPGGSCYLLSTTSAADRSRRCLQPSGSAQAMSPAVTTAGSSSAAMIRVTISRADTIPMGTRLRSGRSVTISSSTSKLRISLLAVTMVVSPSTQIRPRCVLSPVCRGVLIVCSSPNAWIDCDASGVTRGEA